MLANSFTPAVDARAAETKERFKELGGWDKLLPHVFSDEAVTVAYALGALRNSLGDIEDVERLEERGDLLPRLEASARLHQ